MWRWGREMEEKMPGQGGHGWNERIVRRTSTCVRDSSRWRGELWASSWSKPRHGSGLLMMMRVQKCHEWGRGLLQESSGEIVQKQH